MVCLVCACAVRATVRCRNAKKWESKDKRENPIRNIQYSEKKWKWDWVENNGDCLSISCSQATIFVHKLIHIVFADVITITSNSCADKCVWAVPQIEWRKAKNAKVIAIIKQQKYVTQYHWIISIILEIATQKKINGKAKKNDSLFTWRNQSVLIYSKPKRINHTFEQQCNAKEIPMVAEKKLESVKNDWNSIETR